MEEREEINRVEKDVQQWLHSNPRKLSNERRYADRKLEFLEKLTAEYKGRTYTKGEEKAVQKAELEKAHLNRRLQPWRLERWFDQFGNPVARLLTKFLQAFREQVSVVQPDRPKRTKRRKEAPASKRPEPTDQNPGKIKNELKKSEHQATPEQQVIQMQSKTAVMDHLKRVLTERGIPGTLNDETSKAIARDEKWIFIKGEFRSEKDVMKYFLRLDRSDDSGRYYPAKLDLQLKKDMAVDGRNVRTLDVSALERRMQAIDWTKDYFTKGIPVSGDPLENKKLFKEVNGIFDDLLMLWSSGRQEDRKVHDALALKYLVWTPAEQMLPEARRLTEGKVARMHVNLLEFHEPVFSMRQYYNVLDGRPVQGPTDANGQTHWYETVKSRHAEDIAGSLQVARISGSQQFSLKDAMAQGGLATNPRQSNKWIRQLKNGEKIEAGLIRNGVQEKRVLSLSPTAVRSPYSGLAVFTFDLKASREKGFYQPESRDLRKSIDRYFSAQKNAMWNRAEKWQQKMEGKSLTNGHPVRKVHHSRRIG